MEKVKILGSQNSYLLQILFELRDKEIQKDRSRFRMNMERAGFIMGYEISKNLNYIPKEVTTPLGSLTMNLPEEEPIICTILRAGIPYYQGFQRLFDKSDAGFISAYRHHTDENEFIIRLDYVASPILENRNLLLVDPMIATGQSIVVSYKALLDQGTPKRTIISGVIASEEAIEYILKHIPKAEIYVLAIDGELTAKSFIVPGLGDAGDLAFGNKD